MRDHALRRILLHRRSMGGLSMMQASHTFHRAHFWRVEAIDVRRRALVQGILELDNTARSPYSRELWRGWRNAAPDVQARYDRLCRIVSRYRIRGFA